MTNTTSKLLPVTLPSWPSCEDCISWSQDNLAVAGGELIYILTPKSFSLASKSAGHPQWDILNLRVNNFRYDEWPEQTPASIRDVSLGEEQSSSHVVALSWSSPGLGVHKRSVLGVLTSNLLLSLWDTDGSHAQYQRTCIVNDCSALRRSVEKDSSGRRARRVRSFAWVPPLRNAFTTRWGLHHLAMSNDSDTLIFLRIAEQEGNKQGSGKWNFELALELNLDNFDSANTDTMSMSPLQRRLHHQTPITKIDISPWSQMELVRDDDDNVNTSSKTPRNGFQSNVTITRGSVTYTTRVCATMGSNGRRVSLYHAGRSSTMDTIISRSKKLSRESSVTNSTSSSGQMGTPTQEFFREVIQPIYNDFDSTHQLFGHTRAKFWGSTVSPDNSDAVTCVTLHPSDSIEYIIPSNEKSILVFKKTGRTPISSSAPTRSAKQVQEFILRFAQDSLSEYAINSLFDKKLHRAYVDLARVVLDPASELRNSLELLPTHGTSDDAADQDIQMAQTEINHQSPGHHALGIEACEICGSGIAFTTDVTGGTCDSGHQFSRCQISFLSIQEPGISKYCSECSKQFLDLAKLGPVEGPSFAQKVFDEFDLCPYCQGKFRG